MATVTETPVNGFISCIDPRCAGYEQKPVEVVLRTVAFSYQDNGGDGAVPQTAIERETVAIVQTDEPCEHCGKPTIRAQFERPEYAPVSGQDPLELLSINQQTQIRDVQTKNLETAKDAAELKALIALQGQKLAEMEAELARRRGGRPRKESEEE